ncbi:lysophospholipid acyltransferase family protein [Syntrophomonas palmitatica]|uniref:lysophospholipid acyltransferase family protein n=1 Tax=Syntrophomonas palmitatica TaxID=402877 RepID=UPI001FA6F403|nr:lysophospholipid acyltransferase family protein [Syntrophomonas palmitatica]
MKSEGIHKLPDKGPVIVAANHVSNWDPILVGVVLKRPVHFMAKAELFQNRFLSALFSGLHAFPVKRGAADRKAIRKAMDLLDQGEILGIFPEGARKKLKPDAAIQSGVAMIALKTGVPVLPVACIGTDRNFPLGWFKPLMVRIGNLITLEEYHNQKVNSSSMEELSQKIMQEINLLMEF